MSEIFCIVGKFILHTKIWKKKNLVPRMRHADEQSGKTCTPGPAMSNKTYYKTSRVSLQRRSHDIVDSINAQ